MTGRGEVVDAWMGEREGSFPVVALLGVVFRFPLFRDGFDLGAGMTLRSTMREWVEGVWWREEEGESEEREAISWRILRERSFLGRSLYIPLRTLIFSLTLTRRLFPVLVDVVESRARLLDGGGGFDLRGGDGFLDDLDGFSDGEVKEREREMASRGRAPELSFREASAPAERSALRARPSWAWAARWRGVLR